MLDKLENGFDYQASNNDVRIVNFFDSPEAKLTKKEAEDGKTEANVNLSDFANWINKINTPL
ncbi:hypothetical protein [Lactobacillus sp. B4007]|uniref:hypothetical protein n=1 Tax=Lactobacillus sp. B4007 TaxID=2818032 RepID=UPI002269E681|nr:hypothetical protein [Lactobacillus sp. B4007]MCX8725105.1 hypothetical protein [Lactobacillus sp. B4007]